MNNINIVFSTDNNYAFPTCVTMMSMLENKKKSSHYSIYILISDDFMEQNKKMFAKIKEKFENASIEFVSVPIEIFSECKSYIPHISVIAFYRLIIAKVLKDVDRCIYMDGDIIVLRDLWEMYNIDMTDYYVAGVKSYRHNIVNERERKFKEKIGIESLKGYIVGAPIVMNLYKIREDNMTERFMEGIEKKYPTGDQDVINIYCYNHIYHLPLKMNLLSRYIGLEELLVEPEIYSEKEIEDAISSPVLIHYAGRLEKPWVNKKCKGHDLWWNYAEKVECQNEYSQLRASEELWSSRAEVSTLIKTTKNFKKICIWGYTEIGKNIYDYIESTRTEMQELYFADNDTSKSGMKYKESIVMEGKEILRHIDEEVIHVITNQLCYKQIWKQLLDAGVNESRIYIYVYKSKDYYMSLDLKYKEDEIREIMDVEAINDKYWTSFWLCENKYGDME